MKIKKVKISTEELAMMLHESGRGAVLANKVLKKDGAPEGQIKFIGWDDLPQDARDGRIMQAVFLLQRLYIRKLFFEDL